MTRRLQVTIFPLLLSACSTPRLEYNPPSPAPVSHGPRTSISAWHLPPAGNTADARTRIVRGRSYNNGNPNHHGTYGSGSVVFEDRLFYARDFTGSPTVLIGFASQEQAYLSEDALNLYTEWTVQVEQVWTQTGPPNLSAGSTITIHRAGGALRTPSGELLKSTIDGIPSPLEMGRRFVLFLGYEAEGSWFRLDKAWGIANRMSPADPWDAGSGFTNQTVTEFHRAFNEYERKFATRY